MTTPSAKPRSCGACTLCCKVLTIGELNKPGGVWCGHCHPGQGCTIHGAHPPSCRTFACHWLKDSALADRLRPDRSKVVLTSDPGGPLFVAYCDPASPLAWRRDPIYGLLKARARENTGFASVIVVRAGLRLWLITPKADADFGEVDLNAPLDVTLGSDGMLHVNILGKLSQIPV